MKTKITIAFLAGLVIAGTLTYTHFPRTVEVVKEVVKVKYRDHYPQISAYCTDKGGKYESDEYSRGTCTLKGEVYSWDIYKGDFVTTQEKYLNGNKTTNLNQKTEMVCFKRNQNGGFFTTRVECDKSNPPHHE